MANAKPKAEQRQPWRDPEAKPYIEIQNVTKKFGDFTAVDDVSLNVYQGELFSLLGGSGCGKTTLLRMLAGFETPTSGRILIDGVDMAHIPPYLRPDQYDVPVLCPLPAYDGGAERGLRAAPGRHAAGGDRPAGG